MFDKIKNGFTLSEVLITLVIIGVVAALTIPTAINRMQREELRSQFKKAVSTTSQVIQKMKADYGDIIFDSVNDSELDFRNKFIKYISVTCKENCLDKSKYRNYANFENDGELINYQLKNCITAQDGIIYCFYKGISTTYYINFDINGDKNPNRWGYDVFTFYIDKSDQILKPVTLEKPLRNTFYCNNSSATHNGAACAEKAISDPNYFKNLP